MYPAAFDLPNVLSVASVNADLGLSYFTNYGSESVDVAAVGREVESTLPGDKTGPMTGTSQAAAVVSGIVAECLAQDHAQEAGETAAGLAERVKQTSRKLSSLDGRLAAGYIDAQNLAAGEPVTEIEAVNPADDFDMWAEKTPQENWELFSAGKIVKVVNSTYVTLALLDDGTVWAWGTNTFKQLGTNANVGSSYTPVQIAGLSNVTDVSISLYCCLALKSDGTVWMWGIDFFGQMGRGVKSVTASVPGQTPGLTNIIKASMSFGHTLAASSTNVWSFGDNYGGQLGTGDTTNRYEYSPVQVITGGSISALYAASGSRSYVCNNGEVYACGNNENGKLGIGSSEANIATFTKLPGLAGASDIGNGMALVDGDVYTWGAGSTPETNLPAKVSGLSNVTAISHENNSWYLVVDADKNVWAWGNNTYGQLGDGTTVAKSAPTKFPVFPMWCM